jgi:hypothetical protein
MLGAHTERMIDIRPYGGATVPPNAAPYGPPMSDEYQRGTSVGKHQGRHARPSRRGVVARRAAIVGGQALSASALLGSLAGAAHADGAGGR